MIKHYAGLLPTKSSKYVEPFMGGGAMFLHVRETMPSYKEFVINDLNFEIMNVYSQIRDYPQQFIAGMTALSDRYIPLGKDDRKKLYYDLRQQYMTDFQKWTPVEEAYNLYFLLKTSFNGIWQTCKASQGRFGTPCGLLNQKVTVFDPSLVRDWAELLQGVTIETGDWKSCVERHDGPLTWFFLDPPYRGGFTTYGKDFDDTHQLEVIDFMRKAEGAVSLCNRDLGDGFFETHLPDGYSLKMIDVVYTAGRRKKTEDGFEAKVAREVFMYQSTLGQDADRYFQFGSGSR